VRISRTGGTLPIASAPVVACNPNWKKKGKREKGQNGKTQSNRSKKTNLEKRVGGKKKLVRFPRMSKAGVRKGEGLKQEPMKIHTASSKNNNTKKNKNR